MIGKVYRIKKNNFAQVAFSSWQTFLKTSSTIHFQEAKVKEKDLYDKAPAGYGWGFTV